MPWNFSREELGLKLAEKLNMPKVHIQKLKQDLDYLESRTYFDKINYIILFGSCSKGIATLRSDIDLCVITEEVLGRYDIADMRITLNDDTQFRVETNVVVLDEKTYREEYNKQRLYREIGAGVQIYYKGGAEDENL